MNLPEWLRTGLEVAGIAGGLISSASLVTAWAMSRGFVSKEAFSQYRDLHEKEHGAVGGRLDKSEQRFAAFDADMRHRPGYGVIDALRQDIAQLNASLRAVAASDHAMEERFAAIEGQIARLTDYLLANGTGARQ